MRNGTREGGDEVQTTSEKPKQQSKRGCKGGKANEGSEQTSRMSHKKKMAGQTELQWREPGEKEDQTAHERTSQASTRFVGTSTHRAPQGGSKCGSSLEQVVREQTCTGVADKATGCCARARRIFCVTSEKKEKPESGACRGSEPGADKPARACGASSEMSMRLEHLSTAEWLPRRLQEKMCLRKNTKTYQPTAAT